MVGCPAIVMLLHAVDQHLHAVDQQYCVVLKESSFWKCFSVQHSKTSFKHSSTCVSILGGVVAFATTYTED